MKKKTEIAIDLNLWVYLGKRTIERQSLSVGGRWARRLGHVRGRKNEDL